MVQPIDAGQGSNHQMIIVLSTATTYFLSSLNLPGYNIMIKDKVVESYMWTWSPKVPLNMKTQWSGELFPVKHPRPATILQLSPRRT